LEGTSHAFANFRCNFVQLCKLALPIFVSFSILTIPLHNVLVAGRQLWAVWIGAEVPRSCPTYRVTVSPDNNQHSEPSMSHCCQYENTSKVSTGIKLRIGLHPKTFKTQHCHQKWLTFTHCAARCFQAGPSTPCRHQMHRLANHVHESHTHTHRSHCSQLINGHPICGADHPHHRCVVICKLLCLHLPTALLKNATALSLTR